MTSVTLPATEAEVADLLARTSRLRTEVAKVIVGQEETVEQLLLALLAGGHALLEGVPGLAKTLMIRTLADALALDFRRIQFTPDLMPTDIVGTELLEEDHGTGRKAFKFAKGPIFSNIVLADEINRTPPKTQAALLEAMQEGAVTYAGTTYQLPRPFFVLATQNPIEQAGTYPLPEAQLDRFLLFVRVGYPSEADEVGILARTTGTAAARAEAVLGGADLRAAQALVRQVHVSEELLRWAARLVRATRPADSPVAAVKEQVRWGAGPRAGQAIVLAAKARALLLQRFAVTLDDLRAVAAPVLRHRVLVGFRAEADGITSDDVVRTLLAQVPAPHA
jgi:MoxR-like ATPase